MTATLVRQAPLVWLDAPAADRAARLYRRQLDAIADGNLRSAGATWDLYFDPDRVRSLVAVGRTVGNQTTLAQQQAVDRAADYLDRLAAADVDRFSPEVGARPGGRPLGILGLAALGFFVAALVRETAAAGRRADTVEGRAQIREQAATSTRGFLNRVAANEPHRVANHYVAHWAEENRVWWRLVLTPDACDKCVAAAADREAIAPVHPNCRCVVRPMPRGGVS